MMMNAGERKLMLDLIRQVGCDWEAKEDPEAIRLDGGKLDLMLAVQKYFADCEDVLTLCENAPEFCSVFQAVTMRNIKEGNSGSANTG